MTRENYAMFEALVKFYVTRGYSRLDAILIIRERLGK
jgi:hypothetical protein